MTSAENLKTRATRLAIAFGLLALVWLVALPYAASTPAVAERIDWLDQQGIDPSAMYYTELEMMQPIFQDMALNKRE